MSYHNQTHQERDNLQEQIIRLRIRTAVLENELNIKTREAAEAERSMILVAKAFVGHPVGTSISPTYREGRKINHEYTQECGEENGASLREQVRIMEREIEDLRRENRAYKEKIKKSRQVNALIPLAPAGVRSHEGQPANTSIPAGGLGPHTPEAHSENVFFSLAAPSSPLLPANYSAGVANIGIISLNDELGPEDEDIPNTPSPSPKAKDAAHAPLSKAISPQDFLGVTYEALVNKSSLGAIQQFRNVPTPTVLKTGFELNGSYRGRTYEVGGGPANSEDDSTRQIPAQGYLAQSRYAHADDNLPGGVRIWKSSEEKASSMFNQTQSVGPQDLRCPNIFKYGLTYVPTKEDSNYIRTVHIGNLPKGIHLRDVLMRVRGGQIVSAILADTTSITGSATAIIEFVHETAAEDYARFTSLHPITFDDDDKITADVTHIHTPTYPLTSANKYNLLNRNQTRCFCIRSFPNNMAVSDLQHRFSGRNRHRANCLLETYFDEEKNLHLEFSSLLASGNARAVLSSWSPYRDMEVQSEPDPCARPVEELLLDVPMRRPFVPKAGFIDSREVQRGLGGHEIELDGYDDSEVALGRGGVIQNADEIVLDI
ncbi:uncharacterized protein BP5553_00031 [Venustampulla echinocandica]|uniref:RRM domain-containing protein n=1 Tax=Venustampulla echinocandica TaxID=2656787 RepID=A0A370TX01_9HELO|nr:uncharacterized protein BP5553_00031 [Venustampulla echinocandica]RDL40052.1 hypothetical protein BP5553_00031 [Venustampulla echinocandica]